MIDEIYEIDDKNHYFVYIQIRRIWVARISPESAPINL